MSDTAAGATVGLEVAPAVGVDARIGRDGVGDHPLELRGPVLRGIGGLRVSGETIWQATKQPTGSLTQISVDLAQLVGRSGRLTLRVVGSGGTAQDGIYWIRPRIDVPSPS